MDTGGSASDIAGGQLAERAFRTLRPPLPLGGASPACGPLGGLRHDHQLGYFLANARIAVCARLFGALNHEIYATRALRIPSIRLVGLFELRPLFGVDTADAGSAL